MLAARRIIIPCYKVSQQQNNINSLQRTKCDVFPCGAYRSGSQSCHRSSSMSAALRNKPTQHSPPCSGAGGLHNSDSSCSQKAREQNHKDRDKYSNCWDLWHQCKDTDLGC